MTCGGYPSFGHSDVFQYTRGRCWSWAGLWKKRVNCFRDKASAMGFSMPEICLRDTEKLLFVATRNKW